ncbi:hypothetical protein RRG08_051367 [Elysia crispata]|uniref:Uncharacterized protein n=1 Tax=Elysia crispata TaxID=231223 RepID=A0AAE1B3V7_9GAST|nr:hypothetical protein RRG08_051367 [Elysia crispata]
MDRQTRIWFYSHAHIALHWSLDITPFLPYKVQVKRVLTFPLGAWTFQPCHCRWSETYGRSDSLSHKRR